MNIKCALLISLSRALPYFIFRTGGVVYMEYPLIIDGKTCGIVETRQEGLYTHIEAAAPKLNDNIIKIWLWGGNNKLYLGTMIPENGMLHLRRKISSRELSVLSAEIEYASNRDVSRKEVSMKTEEIRVITEKAEDAITLNEPEAPAEGDACICEIEDKHGKHEDNVPGLLSESINDNSEDELKERDILWFSTPEGTLRGFDGEKIIVALPAELHNAPRGAKLRNINGKDYMVFCY